MLKAAGVDLVMTVHNHKPEVVKEIYQEFCRRAINRKTTLYQFGYRSYCRKLRVAIQLVRLWNYGEHVGFVAPDDGAVDFVRKVQEFSG